MREDVKHPVVLITGCSGLIGSRVANELAPDHHIVGLDVRPPQRLVDRLALAGRVHEHRRVAVSIQRRLDPVDLLRPVDPVEPVDVHDDRVTVHDDQHGVVLGLREVETGVVAMVRVRRLPVRRDRALPHVAKHLASALDELGPVLLVEHAVREPRPLGLDQVTVEDWVGPARVVPAAPALVPALPAAEQVVEVPLALRRADQQRPALLVDQPLGQVALPDHRLQPGCLVHDQEVEALAEQRDRVVRRLRPDLRDAAAHVAQDQSPLALLHRDDVVAQVLEREDLDLPKDPVGEVIGRGSHPADPPLAGLHRRCEALHRCRHRLAPAHPTRDDPSRCGRAVEFELPRVGLVAHVLEERLLVEPGPTRLRRRHRPPPAPRRRWSSTGRTAAGSRPRR